MSGKQDARVSKPSVKAGVNQPCERYRFISLTKSGDENMFKWLGEF